MSDIRFLRYESGQRYDSGPCGLPIRSRLTQRLSMRQPPVGSPFAFTLSSTAAAASLAPGMSVSVLVSFAPQSLSAASTVLVLRAEHSQCTFLLWHSDSHRCYRCPQPSQCRRACCIVLPYSEWRCGTKGCGRPSVVVRRVVGKHGTATTGRSTAIHTASIRRTVGLSGGVRTGRGRQYYSGVHPSPLRLPTLLPPRLRR